MKKNTLLLLVGAFVLISCEKDKVEPTIDDRDKIVGTWSVSDQTLTKANYVVRISKDSENSRKIWISNFHGLLDSAFAFLSGNSIELSQQNVAEQVTMGNGNIQNAQQINWQYWVSDGAQQDTIIATYQKSGK
jgi:hypothetical protein